MLRGEFDHPNFKNSSIQIYGAIAFALLCLILRHFAISWVGRVAIVATCAGTVIALLMHNARLAVVLGTASYALVSRDFEWIAFMPALILSSRVGHAFAANFHSEEEIREPVRNAWT